MDTMQAFGRAMAAQGNEPRVFDWVKAAQLIKASGAKTAAAGLRGDWENTGGAILEDGKPVRDSYTFLRSVWAEPELTLDDGPEIECWRLQSEVPEWDAKTKWPPEALAILEQV